MGGLYGNAAATALEDCPEEARGVISGILQQGYALGYLLCAAFAQALVGTTPHTWRPLFWFGACPPILIIIWRLFLGENEAYEEHARLRYETGKDDAARTGEKPSTTKTFIKQGRLALKKHWLLLTYLVLLMAGFNFLSHGSQDLYPTLLEDQLEFSRTEVTVTQVVANVGAILGGTVIGYGSQIVGRRFSIIVCCFMGGALLYPYSFADNNAIIAAAFFQQFFVQGAWGVVPIHLMELSPGAFRTFVVGTSYQLGNLISSASSTIEARLGERFPLPPGENGKERYEYGRVICIFVGCVYAYLLVLTVLGPEHVGRKFGIAHDADVRETSEMVTISRVVSREDERGSTLRRMEEARRVWTI
jgi:MFS transporter, SHS family, lactate transporter